MYKEGYYNQLENYIKLAPRTKEINWFDLPETMCLLLKDTSNQGLKSMTIRKLIYQYGKTKRLNKRISMAMISSRKGFLKIEFPINLEQEDYIILYALMVSEGTFKTEFSLNVLEEFFHRLFEKSLRNLTSNELLIKKDLNNNCKRSRAPQILRYLCPFPNTRPAILFEDKKLAKKYLKIAFEAEGCPIFNEKRSKKYIKLSRNSDISSLIKGINLSEGEKIFINQIKKQIKEYPEIMKNPDSLILGEHLLLKHQFDIDSSLQLESIRLNSLGNRKGKISAKWVLYIYSGEDLKKFHNEIGFISNSKREKCEKMLERIPSRKKQYYPFTIMKEIQKDNLFFRKDFDKKMRDLGYVSPQKFIWDYMKNKKLIERLGRGRYRISV